MFGWRRRGTIIGAGLKVVGKVTAEGLVKVYGQVDGDLRCASLILARNAAITGTISAERAVIDGKVEGPIEAGNVVLKSRAHVVGDIHHRSLDIRKGAYFEGRSVHLERADGREAAPSQPAAKKLARRSQNSNLEIVSSADPAA